MRGLSVEGDRVALDAESAEDSPEWAIEIEKDRALLDVQLEIGSGVLEFFAALFYFFEIDSVFGERGGKRDALFVFEPASLFHVEMTGAGGRTEQTFAEARSFFIGPIDEPHRDRRPAVMLRMDSPKNLDAGEGVETTVEPAAVRNGINVAADQQRPPRFAG